MQAAPAVVKPRPLFGPVWRPFAQAGFVRPALGKTATRWPCQSIPALPKSAEKILTDERRGINPPFLHGGRTPRRSPTRETDFLAGLVSVAGGGRRGFRPAAGVPSPCRQVVSVGVSVSGVAAPRWGAANWQTPPRSSATARFSPGLMPEGGSATSAKNWQTPRHASEQPLGRPRADAGFPPAPTKGNSITAAPRTPYSTTLADASGLTRNADGSASTRTHDVGRCDRRGDDAPAKLALSRPATIASGRAGASLATQDLSLQPVVQMQPPGFVRAPGCTGEVQATSSPSPTRPAPPPAYRGDAPPGTARASSAQFVRAYCRLANSFPAGPRLVACCASGNNSRASASRRRASGARPPRRGTGERPQATLRAAPTTLQSLFELLLSLQGAARLFGAQKGVGQVVGEHFTQPGQVLGLGRAAKLVAVSVPSSSVSCTTSEGSNLARKRGSRCNRASNADSCVSAADVLRSRNLRQPSLPPTFQARSGQEVGGATSESSCVNAAFKFLRCTRELSVTARKTPIISLPVSPARLL